MDSHKDRYKGEMLERIRLQDGREIGMHFQLNSAVPLELVKKISDTYAKALPVFSKIMGMEMHPSELPTTQIGWTLEMGGIGRGEFRENDNVIQIPKMFAKSNHGVITAKHELGHFFAYKALFGKLPVDIRTTPNIEAKDKEELLTRYGMHEGIAILFESYPLELESLSGKKTEELAFEVIEMGRVVTRNHLRSAGTICRQLMMAATVSDSPDEFLEKAGSVTSDRYMLGSAMVALALISDVKRPVGELIHKIISDPKSVYEMIRRVDPARFSAEYNEYKAHGPEE